MNANTTTKATETLDPMHICLSEILLDTSTGFDVRVEALPKLVNGTYRVDVRKVQPFCVQYSAHVTDLRRIGEPHAT